MFLLHRFIICRTKISIGGTEEEFEYKVSLGLQKRIAGSLGASWTQRQDRTSCCPSQGKKKETSSLELVSWGAMSPYWG